jgi:ribosome-associated toxin RatA of RatAB toxin-antitoxin module
LRPVPGPDGTLMSTRIERSALLLYPAHAMFALVDDIEAYPRFMAGCVGAEVISRSPELVEARLHLAKAGIRQSFTTRNRLTAPARIDLELIEGPFESFEGRWGFEALREDACKVTLHLAFRMRSGLAGKAVGKLFDSMANTLVDALCQRAREVYGR